MSSKTKLIRKKGNVDLSDIQKVMKRTHVAVGIHKGELSGDGKNLAEIGAINEFGSEHGYIPERSFLRSTFNENIKTYRGDMKQIVKSVVAGKYTIKIGLGRLGRKVENDIKAKITSHIDPPNSEYTIQKKGSSTPLIDEGFLIAAIRHEVRNGQ